MCHPVSLQGASSSSHPTSLITTWLTSPPVPLPPAPQLKFLSPDSPLGIGACTCSKPHRVSMLSPLKYLPPRCRFKSKSETIVPFWTSPFRPTTLLRASGALETAPLAPKCSEFIPEMAFPLPMPVSPLALLLLPTPLFQAAPSSTMHRWTSSPLSIFLLFPSLRLGVPPVCLQAEDRALDPVPARSCVLTLLPAYSSPV